MEFHNPTDVQSVPSVDALHLVNKRHKEEVDALKVEMQNLRDRNDSQMKQLREWNGALPPVRLPKCRFVNCNSTVDRM